MKTLGLGCQQKAQRPSTVRIDILTGLLVHEALGRKSELVANI